MDTADSVTTITLSFHQNHHRHHIETPASLQYIRIAHLKLRAAVRTAPVAHAQAAQDARRKEDNRTAQRTGRIVVLQHSDATDRTAAHYPQIVHDDRVVRNVRRRRFAVHGGAGHTAAHHGAVARQHVGADYRLPDHEAVDRRLLRIVGGRRRWCLVRLLVASVLSGGRLAEADEAVRRGRLECDGAAIAADGRHGLDRLVLDDVG